MSLFGKLSSIDKETKYRVFGLIDEIEPCLSKNVPLMIRSLCLLYYYVETEQFGHHGDDIEILRSNGLNTGAICDYQDDCNTVFGKIKIDPKIYPNSSFNWTLKFKHHKWCGIDIGFTESNNINLNTSPFKLNNPYWYYSWALTSRAKWCRPDSVTISDHQLQTNSILMRDYRIIQNKQYIVKISFDIKKREIRANLNGQDLDILFHDVDISKSYYLAISLINALNPIHLIHFNIT